MDAIPTCPVLHMSVDPFKRQDMCFKNTKAGTQWPVKLSPASFPFRVAHTQGQATLIQVLGLHSIDACRHWTEVLAVKLSPATVRGRQPCCSFVK